MRTLALLLSACCVLAAQSGEVTTTFKRALAEQERGDLSAAIRDYQEVLRARPKMTQVRANLAAALAQSGRLDEAIEAYRAALVQNGGDLQLRSNLGLALYKKGDAAGAVEQFTVVQKAHPQDERTAELLADCYLQMSEFGKALDLVTLSLQSHPDDPNLLYLKGSALIRSGHPEEGAQLLEHVGKLTGSADAYLMAGVARMNLGQLAPARQNLDLAIAKDPALPGALSWAGLARDRNGDEEGAKQAFHQALERDPKDPEANLHLAAILYREREYTEAKPLIDRALQAAPSAPMARYASALITAALGNTEAAVPSLESIVRENPDWLEPRVKLSSLYFKLGRDAEGKREQATLDQLNAEHRGKSSPFETQP